MRFCMNFTYGEFQDLINVVVAAQIEMNFLEFSTIIGKMKDADVEEEIIGTDDSMNIHQ